MITCQTEKFIEVFQEALPLFEMNQREVKPDLPLDLDIPVYLECDERGLLHVSTLRDDEVLKGYSIFIVKTHLHHRTVLHAFHDAYFIHPELRGTGARDRLFTAAETALRERGVQRIIQTATNDWIGSFLSEGYRETGRVLEKVL